MTAPLKDSYIKAREGVIRAEVTAAVLWGSPDCFD